ncbi:prepilin-type N-terminal cleavage/methylation domain-containing protein [Actimicrobium sp. CCI2.3]|nr:prepilin-type N-terminal cleavage/methylation domain-containing protein [Actimicrobium sp. CCI2.3]
MRTPAGRSQRGFTLIEAIMVIVVTGIIAGSVAIFIRIPVQSYFDLERRAEMTDSADTALRRMGREIRLSLPNSVRVSADGYAVEFLHTHSGGRYRVATTASGGGNILDFNRPDTSFDVLGPPVALAPGDQVVIYNLGVPGADAYEDPHAGVPHVRRAYAGPAGNQSSVVVSTDSVFPFDSPGHRFQVVDTPVTYRCRGGILSRYAGYPISQVQPDPPVGGIVSMLAEHVSDCSFMYAPGAMEHNGLVAMRLDITSKDETLTLYHEVHVSNVP